MHIYVQHVYQCGQGALSFTIHFMFSCMFGRFFSVDFRSSIQTLFDDPIFFGCFTMAHTARLMMMIFEVDIVAQFNCLF